MSEVAEDVKRLIFRARRVDEARWKARAKAEGLTFSDWVRRSLNMAIGLDPFEIPERRSVRVPPEQRHLEGQAPSVIVCKADVRRGYLCNICGKVHP
jgi:hypothetical protein